MGHFKQQPPTLYRFQELRLRIYRYGLPLATLVLVGAWLWLSLPALLGFVFLLPTLWLWLWFRPDDLAWIDWGVALTTALFVIFLATAGIWVSDSWERRLFQETAYTTGLLLIILIFMVFPLRIALLFDTTLILVTAGTSLFAFMGANINGLELARNLLALTAGFMTLALLYLHTRFLENALGQENSQRKFAEQLATTDPLTGIANRRAFEEALSREIAFAKRYQEPLTLILFDLDDFKQLNDQYGHSAGDRVLYKLCKEVKKELRQSDIFARWGGEEFVVLAPRLPLDSARYLAERLRASLATMPLIPIESVTASFGVAEFKFRESSREFFQRADAALYQAKRSGKNRVVIANGASGQNRTNTLN